MALGRSVISHLQNLFSKIDYLRFLMIMVWYYSYLLISTYMFNTLTLNSQFKWWSLVIGPCILQLWIDIGITLISRNNAMNNVMSI